jgi:hypothetical protein
MAEFAEPEWRRSSSCSGGNCIEVARDGDRYLIRDSRDRSAAPIVVDAGEWQAFVEGVRRDEFRFE